MQVVEHSIQGVKTLIPTRHTDARGFFYESYSRKAFEAVGIIDDFVQDNHSLSHPVGVLRGLHFQIPPFAQAKLVRVVRGAVFDVVVDIRHGSPSYGHHVSATIRAEFGHQIYVPEGFAHGFCTLEPDTEVIYKVSRYYSASHEAGVLWSDPALRIAWPIAASELVISEKDKRYPVLADIPRHFTL